MFQGSKNAPASTSPTPSRPAPTSARAASTARPTTTARTTSPPSRRATSRRCSGSSRTGSRRSPTPLTKEKLDNQRDVVKNERRQGLENTALRPLVQARSSRTSSRRAPLLVAGHRQPRGPDRRLARGREGLLPDRTTRRTTCRSSSPATSIRPRRSGSSRSTSAPIPPGPPLDRPEPLDPDALRREDRRGRPTACRRSASTWSGRRRAFYRAGRRGARLDLAHPDRRPRRRGSTRRSSTTGSSAPTSTRSRRRVGDRRAASSSSPPRGPGVVARGDRDDRDRGDRAAREGRARPPAELARAKTKQEYDFVTGLERIGGFGGKADRAEPVQHLPRRPGQVRVRTWRATATPTPADVQQAVARWLDTPQPRCSCASTPRSPAAPPTAALDRSKTPAARRRPAVPRARRSQTREARQRPRGLRRRAAATCRRSPCTLVDAGRRRRRSRRARRASRIPDGARRSTSARRRARRSRSRTRSATSGTDARRPTRRARARGWPSRC